MYIKMQMQKTKMVELYNQTFHCTSLSLFSQFSNFSHYTNYSLFLCCVFLRKQKNSKMEMVLVMSISPQFLFCARITEFEYYCFGKSYDTNLYENELLKLYNSTLANCTHLIAKLHLENTKCIAILLGKMQNLVTS